MFVDQNHRKRGPPSKYASKEEKAAAAVERKRAKRRKQSSEQRAITHAQFYGPTDHPLPSSDAPVVAADCRTTEEQNDVIIYDASVEPVSAFPELDELSEYLPPPSPEVGGNALTEDYTDIPAIALPTPLPTQSEHDTVSPNRPNPGNADDHVAAFQFPYNHETYEEDVNVSRFAEHLVEQLTGFKGCCDDCHTQEANEHRSRFGQHVNLDDYLESTADLCPDVLGSGSIGSADLPSQTTPESLQQVFCGLNGEEGPPHICLRDDAPQTDQYGVKFDIDSIVGFCTSIAVAKDGLRWNPTQKPLSDLQSGLHLRPRQVHFVDSQGRSRTVHRPVHKIPHYTLARSVGFEDVSLYALFPRLYREEQTVARLRDVDFRLWMDGVLLPAIYQYGESDTTQHYCSSHGHAKANATARGVESRSRKLDAAPREQPLFSFIQPDCLQQVWDAVLDKIEQPGFHQFRDVTILLHAKNLKLLIKDKTWEGMLKRFGRYWDRTVNEEYTTPEFFFDIAREIYPLQPSHPTGSCNEALPQVVPAETLVWKRCCLEAYAGELRRGLPADSSKETFYALSMLQDSGALTIEPKLTTGWRRDELPYSQLYNSLKGHFAAGDVYVFLNPTIEGLALDRKLRRTWELVGRGLSHNPVALMKAYLYAKHRCHEALQGSVRKCSGVREEHRMSRRLLCTVDGRFHSRGIHQRQFTLSSGPSAPFYSFQTSTIIRWLRWNINKFCVGFETVYSCQDPHFVTWEHTRLMLMFLRCLRYSYGSGLMRWSGGCWRDVRYVADDQQPDGLRRWEGLGFCRTMEESGYAWFMDKIDWRTLTFRPTHSPYMMFNNPSMQNAYRQHYSRIRDVRIDFIRVDRVRQWLIEFSGVPSCVRLLEEQLRQLCLSAFRKDVFAHVRTTLHPDSIDAALSGEIPLCYDSVQEALRDQYRPPALVTGKAVAVKNIDVLFAWLWEWRDGRFERKGWNDKPYRMLYRQSFDAIVAARGKAAARQWKRSLKTSFLQSHWLLPYPDSRSFMRKYGTIKGFVWWPSFHDGLYEHYRQKYPQDSAPQQLPASDIRYHPREGWHLAGKAYHTKYMPFVMETERSQLGQSDQEVQKELDRLRESHSEHGDNDRVPVDSVPWAVQPRRRLVQIEYRRWCSKRLRSMQVTVEDCRTAEDYRAFLDGEKEKYEEFRTEVRGPRRSGRVVRDERLLDDESEESIVERSDENTSDEESMWQKRQRQKTKVTELRQEVSAQILIEQRRATAGQPPRRSAGVQRLQIRRQRETGTSDEGSDGFYLDEEDSSGNE